MTWQAWATAAIIVFAMVLFASEKVRVDLVALITLGLLVALGIVTPDQALSGFSNEATVTVAAMFALALGIERSGALEPIIRLLSRIRSPWLLTLGIMAVTAPLGAFIKNTALVATFLPLTLRICQRTGTSPARVLMPMAFAAQMGGVCTLVGTSSNLLVDSLAQKQGLQPFGIFEFTPMGVLLAIAGIAYMMVIGRWLLPSRLDSDATGPLQTGKYVTELKLMSDSPLIGQTIAEAKLGDRGVYPLELLRGEQHMWSPRTQQLSVGDVLLVRGEWDKLEDFRKHAGLEINPEFTHVGDGDKANVLVEAMIAPASLAEDRTLRDLDLLPNYQAAVLGIHRRGHLLRDKIRDVAFQTGDVLMLLLPSDEVKRLRRDDRFVVLHERDDVRRPPRKAIIAVAIMAAVILVSALRWLPIPIAAICGVAAMALTRCFGRKDVYEGMDWKIIILLGAILPLGIAIEHTGLANVVVTGALDMIGNHGPLAALLMVYVLTALLTELMGHNPSVVLMVGIAVSVAHAVHADPRPFVVAVAFAAATSFATPVGYPTNTMVYYAGGYRFLDFTKVGVPLIALFCALSMYLIPRFWPF
ncbi:MAG TPA: SLC13 family permease [Rhodanobacteraceae bacterium]|jgi:di/tricarboxylate transporter|nr:SLC13 family permease [Rhodanobacteraceae bacterium]